jgi:hypothetical protein
MAVILPVIHQTAQTVSHNVHQPLLICLIQSRLQFIRECDLVPCLIVWQLAEESDNARVRNAIVLRLGHDKPSSPVPQMEVARSARVDGTPVILSVWNNIGKLEVALHTFPSNLLTCCSNRL